MIGQHVIITGGSSGIGRALARRLSARGAHISGVKLWEKSVCDRYKEDLLK